MSLIYDIILIASNGILSNLAHRLTFMHSPHPHTCTPALLLFCLCTHHSRLLLRHSFEKLRSAQVATIHCSAQTSAIHVMQKLSQVCESAVFMFFKNIQCHTPLPPSFPLLLSLLPLSLLPPSLFPSFSPSSSLSLCPSPPLPSSIHPFPPPPLPSQVCMVISTNTGRVYRPRDCERLILYLKDINLPKPDKWGTSQLIAFLQQVRM